MIDTRTPSRSVGTASASKPAPLSPTSTSMPPGLTPLIVTQRLTRGESPGVLHAVEHRLQGRGCDRLTDARGHRSRADIRARRLDRARHVGCRADDPLGDGSQSHGRTVIRLHHGGVVQVADRVARHDGRELHALRRVGARGREQCRQDAVVHDRVDLHALDLGRVMANGVAVPLERRALRDIDVGRRLPEHRDQHDDSATQDDRVHRVEDRGGNRVRRHRPASSG